MTYDNELILISETYTEDEIGNQKPIEKKIPVLCSVKSIGRNEFYSAAVAGLKPDYVFIMHGYEYNGEKKVEFGGVKYKVVRSYSKDFEEVELVCERKLI